ncbi:phosphotransferase family protein [Paenibacillus sp. B01]|uniref:phosphotransferase family protein n=1 Tax=Paenibacillus sp. B01 TaxID=2660554 RepID=UPI001E611702|nr:aminoglycoside phosphotransferase family protein [Paenibacillus sp. B01]
MKDGLASTLGEPIGRGNTATIYRWGKTEVVKLFHDGLTARQEAEKEAAKAVFFQKLGLNAPSFGGFVEFEGRPGLIYERIEGLTMLWTIEPSAASVSAHARMMARLQNELHGVRAEGGPELKTDMARMIQWAPWLTESEKQASQAVLDVLPAGERVCHYDFHPDNIILSPRGPVIIDWMNALVGDPAADVARSSMMLQGRSLPPGAPEWVRRRELRELFHHDYRQEYFSLSGMDPALADAWMVPTFAVRAAEMDRGDDGRHAAQLRSLLAATPGGWT